ncbi:hypothetical protein IT570_03425 [Candidatus Sumerlaeota bacterium]|nr:hypothetical protein [Candidatus Sumerlaeota bacterium]
MTTRETLGAVAVLGAGVTGIAIVQLLRNNGIDCCVIDGRSAIEFSSACKRLRRLHVSYYFHGQMPTRAGIYGVQVFCGLGSTVPIASAKTITAEEVTKLFPDCPFTKYLQHVLRTPEGKADRPGRRVERRTGTRFGRIQPTA